MRKNRRERASNAIEGVEEITLEVGEDSKIETFQDPKEILTTKTLIPNQKLILEMVEETIGEGLVEGTPMFS